MVKWSKCFPRCQLDDALGWEWAVYQWNGNRLSALFKKTHQITKPKAKSKSKFFGNDVIVTMCGTTQHQWNWVRRPYTEFRGVWEDSAVISLHKLIYVKSLRCTHIWWTALVMQCMGLCGSPQSLASAAQREGSESHFQEWVCVTNATSVYSMHSREKSR